MQEWFENRNTRTNVFDIWNKIILSGINNWFNKIKECISNLQEKNKAQREKKWGKIEYCIKDNEVSRSLIYVIGAREKREKERLGEDKTENLKTNF